MNTFGRSNAPILVAVLTICIGAALNLAWIFRSLATIFDSIEVATWLSQRVDKMPAGLWYENVGVAAIVFGSAYIAWDFLHRNQFVGPLKKLFAGNSHVPLREAAIEMFERYGMPNDDGSYSERDRILTHSILIFCEAKNNPDLISIYGKIPPSRVPVAIPVKYLDSACLREDRNVLLKSAWEADGEVRYEALTVQRSELSAFKDLYRKGQLHGQQPTDDSVAMSLSATEPNRQQYIAGILSGEIEPKQVEAGRILPPPEIREMRKAIKNCGNSIVHPSNCDAAQVEQALVRFRKTTEGLTGDSLLAEMIYEFERTFTLFSIACKDTDAARSDDNDPAFADAVKRRDKLMTDLSYPEGRLLNATEWAMSSNDR